MIGTNKDEASLFKFMKSPLMPITEERIMAMFSDMAADNPTVELPSVAQVQTAYENVRKNAVGLGVARDIGFRMPTVWIAEVTPPRPRSGCTASITRRPSCD
jgi:para-nitrobenzyl esterase